MQRLYSLVYNARVMIVVGPDSFFRSMTPDEFGFPVVARSARAPGVRVPEDVELDDEEMVVPGTGGMSVAPTSMWNLPNHRRPRGLKRGSTGPTGDCVFSLESLALGKFLLTARPDPDQPARHAFIEPGIRVPLGSY